MLGWPLTRAKMSPARSDSSSGFEADSSNSAGARPPSNNRQEIRIRGADELQIQPRSDPSRTHCEAVSLHSRALVFREDAALLALISPTRRGCGRCGEPCRTPSRR